ncbi:S-layer homology domain-containing protein [Thermanaeromonas toyohensis ToBE]|uniref:S-layer homology domain-containing protein n=1 Tax=Thermanaeromonas toyohensis ToBE TaxID=698762 RepID=A0A1W1VTS2_9FIRM|nr:S-layer homology domain-containing protein [Thermanaeromonas toyohensis]SMB96673.1 S-layer homology domain-containing protein [Thermanaeromonas toyohensis ToBE]
MWRAVKFLSVIALSTVMGILFSAVGRAGEQRWLAVGVSPQVVDVGTVREGETIQAKLAVVNMGDMPARVQVAPENPFQWSGLKLPIGLLSVEPAWVSCEPRLLVLEKPGDVAEVTVRVTVPPGTPGGVYGTVVVARTGIEDGKSGEVGVLVNTSSVALVTFTVAGEGSAFLDVGGHWAETEVMLLASRGIARGYPDGTFRPDIPVSRLEALLFEARMLRLPGEPAAYLSRFADCHEIPEWAIFTASAAAKAGLVEGELEGGRVFFRPGRPVTRVEAALFVLRALSLEERPTAPNTLLFTDAGEVPAWAAGDLGRAVAAGLIKGYPDGTIRPGAAVTRAELAAMLARVLARIENRTK